MKDGYCGYCNVKVIGGFAEHLAGFHPDFVRMFDPAQEPQWYMDSTYVRLLSEIPRTRLQETVRAVWMRWTNFWRAVTRH